MKLLSTILAVTLPLLGHALAAEPIDLLEGDLSKTWRGFKSDEIPLGWTLNDRVLHFQPLTKEEKAKAGGKKVGATW